MDWYLTVLSKYAEFGGRARRMEYWMFTLINMIIGVVIGAIGGMLAMRGTGLQVVVLAYTLGIIIPSIAVGVRRLHDTGRSGWWMLIAFIPVVGAIILLFFSLQEGERHANEYGPDPKAA